MLFVYKKRKAQKKRNSLHRQTAVITTVTCFRKINNFEVVNCIGRIVHTKKKKLKKFIVNGDPKKKTVITKFQNI